MVDSSAIGETPREDRQPARGRKTRRLLNVRLLVGTLIALAILVPAAWWWRALQVRRTAGALLERADDLAEDGDFAAACSYLLRYLELYPNDADVRVLLAQTYDRSVKGPRGRASVIQRYQEALGVAAADKMPALRRRLAELLLEAGRFALAVEEAQELLKQDERDPQGRRLLALARFAWFLSGDPAATREGGTPIGEDLEQALELNPGDPRLATALADVHREHRELLSDEKQALSTAERAQLPDKVIDDMVSAKPKDPKVYLDRYRYRLRYKLPQREDDLQQALRFGPDDLEVLLFAAAHSSREAIRSHDSKLYDEVCALYEHAIQVAPKDEQAYVGLGELYAAQRQFDRAKEIWRRGLERTYAESVSLNLRLADVLIDQGEVSDAEDVLKVLARVAERRDPRLDDANVPPGEKAWRKRYGDLLKRANDLLKGRWLARKGDYFQAIPVLKRVAVDQTDAPSDAARGLEARVLGDVSSHGLQAWIHLGEVYGALSQWDQAADAYEQAAALQPKMVQPRLRAAAAWAAAGRPDMAIRHYERAITLYDSPEIQLALASARFEQEVRRPKAERSWDAFLEAKKKAEAREAKEPLRDPWRLKLLEADYAVSRAEEQGQPAEGLANARKLYQAAESEFPDSAGLLQTLVLAYERLGLPEDADRTLEKLEKLGDQSRVACLLRARLHAGRKEYDQARQVLRDGLKKLPRDARPALQRELAQVDLQEGRLEQAREQLAKFFDEEPSNLQLACRLAELAFEAGNLKDVEQWEKRLRGLEGPDGVYWQYYAARRLLEEAKGPEDPNLVRASELLSGIQRLRPTWPAAHLLDGLLQERRGKFEQAIEAYQEAIRLGERRLVVYERLISLLNQSDRAAEADKYLSLLQDQIAAFETLSSLEMSVAARRGQLDRALEIARRGVERRPQDPMAHAWLGQMLLANDKPDEAEKALKQAVQLAPSDIRALGVLFGFYARTRQPDRARQTLEEVLKNEKLTELERALVAAQSYELLADLKQAESSYRQAARLAAEDPAVQLQVAQFLLRHNVDGDTSEAEKVIRGVLKLSPRLGPARRLLAEILVERGGEKESREAQDLLGQPGADPTTSSGDRRLQAALLARRRGKENLEKAREILEGVVAESKRPTASDRLQLARIYEAEGNLPAARQQYTRLVSQENPRAVYLGSFVDFLLRHDLPDDAEQWLKRLAELSPEDLGTVALRARWLRAKGRVAEIEPLVEDLAKKREQKLGEDKEQQVQFFLRVGSLYSAAGQYQAAGRWYRRITQIAPDRYEPLALSLARQDRMREAITLCAEAAKSDSSLAPAIALTAVLLSGQPTADDFQLAEPLLVKAVEDHRNDVNLLLQVAAARVLQGGKRVEDAVRLYRQVLALQPRHVWAMNNLATLLSEQNDKSKRQEALKLIDRAIQIAGPQPGLLDTKGMILVYDGKADEAVPLLQEAALAPEADPRYAFHLAVAYCRTGENDKAGAALKVARKGNLTSQVLTEKDRTLLAELEQKLPP